MGLILQKLVGAVLLALIVVIGINKVGAVLVPHDDSVAADLAVPASAKQAAAPAAAPKSFPELLAAATPEEGKTVAKKCAACHSFEDGAPNKVGPNLHGVVGRKKAAKEGFAYSAALSGLSGNWTYEDLNTFLTKPSDFAPGTKMTFAGLKEAKDRAAVIAYLKSESPNAPALPQ